MLFVFCNVDFANCFTVQHRGRRHLHYYWCRLSKAEWRLDMINLFIDTNIWLAMFHLSKDDLEALNQLKELIGKEIKIYIPRQVKYEYLRNRDSKIKDALDKFMFNFLI